MSAQLCVQTLGVPTSQHHNQKEELGNVPRPSPPSRDAKQGARPGEPPPLPVEQQAAQALPPCLLQLVEGVCGIVPGRAEAEDLVVLLQSCLPAFCTAVRHLQRGDRKRGSWIQPSRLCPFP